MSESRIFWAKQLLRSRMIINGITQYKYVLANFPQYGEWLFFSLHVNLDHRLYYFLLLTHKDHEIWRVVEVILMNKKCFFFASNYSNLKFWWWYSFHPLHCVGVSDQSRRLHHLHQTRYNPLEPLRILTSVSLPWSKSMYGMIANEEPKRCTRNDRSDRSSKLVWMRTSAGFDLTGTPMNRFVC